MNWNSLLTHQDRNRNCNLLSDTFYRIYYSTFPKVPKFIVIKRLQKPWITHGILKSIHNKFALYKVYKTGMMSFEDYKKYRNDLNIVVKLIKNKLLFTVFFQVSGKIPERSRNHK